MFGIVANRAWVVKSLGINAVGSGIDYALVFFLLKGLELPTPLGIAAGLLAGATFNFLMNRRFAFAESQGPLGSQALRYALGTGSLMLIHASAVTYLRDGMDVPLFYAKILCDVSILSGGSLLVMRYLVFRGKGKPGPALAGP